MNQGKLVFAYLTAQLTFRESLRDIEACLGAQRAKLYHLGIRSVVARNTLANANAVRKLLDKAGIDEIGDNFHNQLFFRVYVGTLLISDLCLQLGP